MKKRVDKERINIRVILILIIVIVLFIALYLVISPRVRLSPAPSQTEIANAVALIQVLGPNGARWLRGEINLEDNQGNSYGPEQRTAFIQALGGQSVVDAALGGSSSTCRVLLGDVNDDGRVNGEDYNNLLSGIVKCPRNADVNGDGVDNSADLEALVRLLRGEDVSPVDEGEEEPSPSPTATTGSYYAQPTPTATYGSSPSPTAT